MTNNLTSRLRSRITIQKEILVSDDGGGGGTVWQNVAEIWAEVKIFAVSVNNSFKTEKADEQSKYVITTRYLPNISKQMRIKFNNTTFQIVSIENIEQRNEILRFFCAVL